MKTSYLSLTFLIAFLPALLPTFNISKDGSKKETLTHSCNSATDHQHHQSCFANQLSDFESATEQLAFGKELGEFIKNQQAADANYRIKTVVIDPGHGGKDPGCSGTNTKEKVIALSIALKLGRSLQRQFPEVQFIFTRESDVFVPLDNRANIANKNNADLFISIHCNNFPKSGTVKGSETYVLGLHRAEDNLAVAKRENSAIFYEDNYQQTYDGYDPNSAEGHIILSMFQNAFLEQSILFANKIEGNIKKNTSRRSRGVKQAGFLVLRKTTMPSVLVEAGYLSNSSDNQFLSTRDGQNQIVNAIAKAFKDYKSEVEAGDIAVTPDVYASNVQQRFTPKGSVNQIKTPSLTLAQSDRSSGDHQIGQKKPKILKSPSRKVSPQRTKKATNSKISKPSLIIPSKENNASSSTATNKITSEAPTAAAMGIEYKVVLTSTTRLLNTDNAPWKNIPYKVQITKEGKTFKYMAIGFEEFQDALDAKTALRKMGFDEAFLVAYQQGKRIDMKVAKATTGVR